MAKVDALRKSLSVHPSMDLPDAVKHMCNLMGISPGQSSSGAMTPLPTLVDMLIEATGVQVSVELQAEETISHQVETTASTSLDPEESSHRRSNGNVRAISPFSGIPHPFLVLTYS